MLDELWVNLAQWPQYAISNYGRVVNENTGRELAPYADKRTGHLRVALYNNGVREDVQINRLVAECFFVDYRPDVQVYHENGNKSDNGVLNLTLGRSREMDRDDA